MTVPLGDLEGTVHGYMTVPLEILKGLYFWEILNGPFRVHDYAFVRS